MRCRAGWQYLNGTTQRLLGWFLLLVILGYSFRVSKVDIGALIGGFSQSLALVRDMLPPDFSRWKYLLSMGAETVAIGFWGTVFGMIFSFLSSPKIV